MFRSHVFPGLGSLVLVNEIWHLRPLCSGDAAEQRSSTGKSRHSLLEVFCEWFVVQKHVIVMMLVVESIFRTSVGKHDSMSGSWSLAR